MGERADGIPGTCGGLGRANGAELVLEAHGMPHSDTLIRTCPWVSSGRSLEVCLDRGWCSLQKFFTNKGESLYKF